jgi:hypothetical protein
MSIKSAIDFHNRFDPISDENLNLVPSNIGPNMNWSRPSIYKQYKDVKFSKGVDIPLKLLPSAEDYILGSGFTFNFNRFATTFILKPDYDVVNGVVQGSGAGARHGHFAKNLDSYQNFMSLTSLGTDIGFTQYFTRINGISYTYNITTGFNMTAGNIHSVAFFLERDGIGTTNEVIRIYIDKVKVYSSPIVPAIQSLTSGTLYYGIGINNGFFGLTFQNDGGIDNPKEFNKFTSKITEQDVDDVLDNLDIEGILIGRQITNKYNFQQHRGIL